MARAYWVLAAIALAAAGYFGWRAWDIWTTVPAFADSTDPIEVRVGEMERFYNTLLWAFLGGIGAIVAAWAAFRALR